MILAQIITCLHLVHNGKNCGMEDITLVFHIDNENAENIAKTRRARIKSWNLARLAKLLNTLSITLRVKSIYTRISTSENSVSDRLSRTKAHSRVNLSVLLGSSVADFCDNLTSMFLGSSDFSKILQREKN